MTGARGGLVFASVLLIAAGLMSSYIASADPGPSLDPTNSEAASDYSRSTLSLVSHLMTQSDVDDMKARFGVRAAGEVYEPAVIDGFGTGLTPHTDAQWQQLVGEMLTFEVDSLPTASPSTFDLSVNPEFPAVGNQASQGSCSAWAGIYYSYGYLEAVDNGWTSASLGDPEQLLSPAWTYNMVNDNSDQGSWIDTNLMVARDWGVAAMATMPYDDSDYTSWGSPEAFRVAPLHRAYEVGYLEYSASTTIDAIKALVTAGTPVAFAMDASEYSSGFSDGNYIISALEYSSTSLNHAQTIVGYDDALSDDSDVGAFRVVNSWGDDWGDSGYYWFTYSALKELGSLGILTVNFAVDIADYQPSLLGVWHFDTAPSRGASIEVSVGSESSPEDTKTPYFVGSFNNRARFPTFMCLDMTEFSDTFWSDGGMHLSVGTARYDGVISSFKVEAYESSFEPGRATQSSGQSDDVPANTPTTVDAYLDYYAPIATEDALESTSLVWSTSGQAAWVAVDHHSSGDGDSMQTGDVSDGASSRLETQVEGPADVSFDWMVSSQSDKDVIEFLVDDVLTESLSGVSGWTTVTLQLGSDTHTLAWLYVKDGSTSGGDDTGWLDSVSAVTYAVQPPTIALDDSYSVAVDSSFTIEPASLTHPDGSVVTVWYDWGDSGPWSMATEDDGYSATHVYSAEGTYDLTAYAVDDFGSNVSDGATVHVLVPNDVPSILSVTGTPDLDEVLPGDTVTFTVRVSDVEGGSVTVLSSYGDGSAADSDVIDAVLPGQTVEFEFTHCYLVASDSAYDASFTATDGDEHLDADWQQVTLEVLVNTPPVAVLSVDFESADAGVAFAFDASASSDAETDHAALQYRWDWNGDGTFDTDWSLLSEVTHSYDVPGDYDASVEVKDGAGLVTSASVTVTVTGEAIPEFSLLVVPVLATVLVALLVRSARRRKDA